MMPALFLSAFHRQEHGSQERLIHLPKEGHTANQWLPVLGFKSRHLESALNRYTRLFPSFNGCAYFQRSLTPGWFDG